MEGGLADDATAEFDANALDLGGVADLEAHPELLGAVVDQQDGEDTVVDDGADEVGYPVHQGVEVESGVESVGERVEEVYLCSGSTRMLVGCVGLLGAGAVVSFEVVFWRLLPALARQVVAVAALFVGRRHRRADDTTAGCGRSRFSWLCSIAGDQYAGAGAGSSCGLVDQ